MKQYKHDYASPVYKAYAKILYFIRSNIKDYTRLYPFYRSYRHRKKIPQINEISEETRYITQLPERTAGFGHGMDIWRGGIEAALLFNIPYAYSRMVSSEWDEKLGLGLNLVSAEELLKNGYKKIHLPYYHPGNKDSLSIIEEIIRSYKGERVVFFLAFGQGSPGSEASHQYVRDLFWNSPQRKRDVIQFDTSELNVALHIRRGDVSQENALKDPNIKIRWIDDSYYQNIIEQIRKKRTDGRRIRFHIYSEGDINDFRQYTRLPDVELHISEDPIESFIQLCYADIIAVANSSFSIIPGYIGRSLKIVSEDWWGNPPDNGEWILASHDGDIIDIEKICNYTRSDGDHPYEM